MRLVIVATCLALGTLPSTATSAGCPAYAERAEETGHVPAVLPELSGLAASRRHPGIYWAHNDSGHGLVLYAIREDGALVAAFSLRGGSAVDPEDVAVGPCASGSTRSCVYLADTGDNLHGRSRVRIFRVEEPDSLRAGPLAATVLPFVYADGPHDVEALLVDPHTAELYLVTKALFSLGDVYRIDGVGARALGKAVRLQAVPTPPDLDALTIAASVHPSGERLLLRSYRFVWELRRPGAERLADVLTATPTRVPTAAHGLGEAVSYSADGMGYLLGGEGARSPLFRVRCR
ncbi:MAG: hypothetical protein ACREQL_16580 [Candidatus Binatia bacterium]